MLPPKRGGRFNMDDCIFCKIVKGDIPSVKIYEDDRVLAFMDINPVSEGYALVIPRCMPRIYGRFRGGWLPCTGRQKKSSTP